MLKKSLLALAVSSIGLMSLPALADSYVIDTKGAHASINFAVKHLGYSWLTGRFDNFSGEFTYDPAKPEASTISVTIDTTSVNSNHAERDKHLRGSDFLNVEKFPKATFVSKQIKVDPDDKDEFDIIGDLTLNGVTKTIVIEVDKVGEGKDPWGGYRVGFEGETHINMRDFNIKMDLGPASQMVKLELHVEGIKK
ncbi:YceI family protein [Cellvibrio japonicus]|uniref:YceI-like protein, ycel3 n=1 Tax=Cellvibrio japonicus (strain Ueda107) TaxID=498211 RepID=B3PGE4_CELJU|nr:YceI family protein [Cellvibrio japonicus]ACE84371.1 yceI-like protein, ycel3 [Cellvibrio japonicus Ueda107]QEI10936.1 YceI family protein [Cellvibrio japonicus]QEI14512.1 YceI family protein [Cellvibrio japonicus]QEI18090.1 YceI family protein [Cellvibrio japonicus]